MRPVGSCSSMPSITGGLNGAPAGRFLDVSGGVGVLFPPPIGSWESLVDVVAGSSPVGGTRSYCIPNRAGESQFPSVSPPEPTIGLSPRVRGNRSGSAPLSVMTRSIPACAGEPSTSRGRTARSTVYPRVCGGTLRPRWSRRSVYPRVCGGNLAAKVVPPFCSGSIPACAGEPPKRCAMSTICRVYPRVCGGPDRGVQSGILTTVYPRVCGGTKASLAAVPAGLGLSPRVRGNPLDSPLAQDSLRSIPACAGEPGRGRRGKTRMAVYPRVCGGTGLILVQALHRSGLSPRVRGNRPCRAVCPPRRGSIPACAGEPKILTA